MLCPYNVGAIPSGLRRAPVRTHPQLLQDGRLVTSPAFADPRTVIRDYSAVVQPPATAGSAAFGRADDLVGVRRFPRAQLGQAGLTGEPGQLLLSATGEALANALVHGAPRAACGSARRTPCWQACDSLQAASGMTGTHAGC